MRHLLAWLVYLLICSNALLADPREVRAIKIGFIAPLTGAYADWGERVKNGFLLALEKSENRFSAEIHDEGNCEPLKATTAAQKFFSYDRIKIVIGPGCLSSLKAVAPIASQYKAALFSTGLLDDDAITRFSNVINWTTEISVEAKYLAKYMASKKLRRIAVVHSSDAFGEEFGNRLPEALHANGVQASPIERVLLEDSDFRALISKLNHAKPDAIFLNLGESQLAAFAKQLRSSGSAAPLFSGYPAEAATTVKNGGAAVEGLTYTYQLAGQEDSNDKTRFDRAYKERFGNDAPLSSSSYFVYDGIMQLDKALKTCSFDDADCIVAYFKKLGEVHGISGVMKFGPDGSNLRPYGVKQIQNGKFVWVEKKIEL